MSPSPGQKLSVQSAAQRPAAKSRALRNVMVATTAVLLLAGLGLGGWYGYTKIVMHGRIGKLPSGLVALWSGDGNGRDSTGRNNATIPSGVTYAPAKVGQGFKLNGRGQGGAVPRIIVPDAPELNFDANQDFSITVWIKAQRAPTDMNVMDIIDKRIASGISAEPNGYELCLLNGRVTCQMRLQNFGMIGPDLRDGRFHLVAWTMNRNSTTGGNLYVDEAVVATFDPTPLQGTLVNTEPLRIGNHSAETLNCFFTGIIDEVGIYKRALSAEQIRAIYKAASAEKP
jgi:hypothetical protein